MRSLLGLSFFFVVGCSNACPPPVLCADPLPEPPDRCPCLIAPAADTGVTPPDAFVDPVDAHVAPTDDSGADAGELIDADVDAAADAG